MIIIHIFKVMGQSSLKYSLPLFTDSKLCGFYKGEIMKGMILCYLRLLNFCGIRELSLNLPK